MSHNSYPTLSNQPIRPYSYNNFPPQHMMQPEPILVGVPVNSNKNSAQYPNLHPTIPIPPSPRQSYNYTQVPQAPNHYAPPQTGVLHQPHTNNLNPANQNRGYVELTETSHSFEKPHHQIDMPHTTQPIMHGQPMVHGQATPLYPHLPGPNAMVSAEPQFAHITAEMHAPVVYDPSLLYKISSREPQIALCTGCNKHVQTLVKYEIGTGTIISSTFLAICGALPCAWVPCCVKDLKDAVHYCPLCGDKLGAKKFIVN